MKKLFFSRVAFAILVSSILSLFAGMYLSDEAMATGYPFQRYLMRLKIDPPTATELKYPQSSSLGAKCNLTGAQLGFPLISVQDCLVYVTGKFEDNGDFVAVWFSHSWVQRLARTDTSWGAQRVPKDKIVSVEKQALSGQTMAASLAIYLAVLAAALTAVLTPRTYWIKALKR